VLARRTRSWSPLTRRSYRLSSNLHCRRRKFTHPCTVGRQEWTPVGLVAPSRPDDYRCAVRPERLTGRGFIHSGDRKNRHSAFRLRRSASAQRAAKAILKLGMSPDGQRTWPPLKPSAKKRKRERRGVTDLEPGNEAHRAVNEASTACAYQVHQIPSRPKRLSSQSTH
jgi:hypothetical protein